MAVQKSRKSRSRRGKKRAHMALTAPTISVELETGKFHLRHHLTEDGFYRGKQMLKTKKSAVAESAVAE